MAPKCVRSGCGKQIDDASACTYHPGPPVFHEGQKGWKCCKPRVLTFEEFMAIPGCTTTDKHTTVKETPQEEPKKPDATATLAEKLLNEQPPRTVTPIASGAHSPAIPPPSSSAETAPAEPDSDDPSLEIPANATCRRRGCNAAYNANVSREEEKCLHHPGQPVFHEGSKGWSCCKRRVLEFDEFMKIPGCTEKKRHLFVGKGKPAGEEKLDDVRSDFYQTASTVTASLYLKKIDKQKAKVTFTANTADVDLPTADNKRLTQTYNLFGPIDPEKSRYNVLGSKLEMVLTKADGTSWPVLRSDDKWSGERIQIGKAGHAA